MTKLAFSKVRARSGAAGNLLTIAVVACLTAAGTAYAANTIGSTDIINDSLRSVDIKDGDIGEADITKTPWRLVKPPSGHLNCNTAIQEFCQITLPEGDNHYWENYQPRFNQVARFRRDATGEVTLQGLVRQRASTHIVDVRIFVLPPGYRPADNLIFPAVCADYDASSNDGVSSVEIYPDGMVVWRDRSMCKPRFPRGYLSLTGISFTTD